MRVQEFQLAFEPQPMAHVICVESSDDISTAGC
jgi:hypothetical protein